MGSSAYSRGGIGPQWQPQARISGSDLEYQMRLTATDIYSLHRPSQCGLRVHLQHQGVPGGQPSAFEEIIIRLGNSHELAQLETLAEVADLSQGTFEQREQRTRGRTSQPRLLYH